MIITISGVPGSGKSTVGKLLAQKLGYAFYSMGDLYGELATKRHMTIDEIIEKAKTDESIDAYIDQRQIEIGQGDRVVIDSLLGFHFIPHSLKIFIDVDPKIAGQRVFENQRPDEPPVKNAEEAATMLTKRPLMNEARYTKYYNVSYLDRSHYDEIIDSSHISPEEVVAKILAKIPKN